MTKGGTWAYKNSNQRLHEPTRKAILGSAAVTMKLRKQKFYSKSYMLQP